MNRIRSAITISLVTEAKGGPFVYWDDLPAGCAAAARLGFDAVEIFPAHPDDLNGRDVRELLQKHNLQLAAVGSGAGWVKHKLRFTDPDAGIRRRALEFATSVVNFAGGLGAPAIIGSMQGRWGDGVSREQALKWLAEALEQLGPRAHALGVPIFMEFLNRYESNVLNNVADTLAFLKPLRTQNVKILCDLFHMNIEEADISAALRLAGDKLGHVHFADTNRLAIGKGHLDVAPIAATLREMNYTGFVSGEIFPLPDSDAAAAQTIASFKQYFPC